MPQAEPQQESPVEADLRARLFEAERRAVELASEKERAEEEARREQLQEALDENRLYKVEAELLQAQYEKLAMQHALDQYEKQLSHGAGSNGLV